MYPRAKPPTPVRQSVDRNAKTRLNLPTHDVVLDPTCRRHHVPLREQRSAAADATSVSQVREPLL